MCLGLLRDTSTSWEHTRGCSSPKQSLDARGSLAWPHPCKPCRIESTPKRHSASHNSSTSHNARGRSAKKFATMSTPRGAALPGPLQKRETFTIRAVTCLQRASQNLRRVSSAPLRIGFECKTKRVSNRREVRSGFRFPRARATSET